MLPRPHDPGRPRADQPARLGRRAALGAVAGLLGAGTFACTARDGASRQPSSGRNSPAGSAGSASPSAGSNADPDVALAVAILVEEQHMVEEIKATAAAHPALRRVIRPALVVHEQHVSLLASTVDTTPEATPTPEQKAPQKPRRTSVNRARTAAIRALARREAQLSLLGRRSALAAESGDFARVLASMAAAASQQGAFLRDLDGPPR